MLKKSLIPIFLLLLIAFPFISQAFAEEGVTDTEIHIAQFGPLTGPGKLWGSTVYGSRLAFRMANEAGGIHGRKIVYHFIDDSYNPAKTKSAVKKMQEKEHIFAWVGGVGTSTGRTVKKYFTKRNIPWIGPLSGSDIWITPPSRNIFALYPNYTIEARELCSYAVNKLKKERVAIVYLNDEYGQSGFKGAKEGLAKYNRQLVTAIPVQRNTSDMRSIAVQLRKAKADTVLLWAIPFQSLRLIMVSKQMKYEPQWMASSTFADTGVMYRLSKGLIEGMIISNWVPFENKALLEKYKEAHTRLGEKDVEWNIFYHAGILFGDLMVEGLKRCGPDLTREKLIETMENMQNFNGIGFTVNYKPFNPNDPSCRQGMNSIYLDQCMKGGESKRLTGWISK
jgi:branched-chain amino acid transport system substrate-binding protein